MTPSIGDSVYVRWSKWSFSKTWSLFFPLSWHYRKTCNGSFLTYARGEKLCVRSGDEKCILLHNICVFCMKNRHSLPLYSKRIHYTLIGTTYACPTKEWRQGARTCSPYHTTTISCREKFAFKSYSRDLVVSGKFLEFSQRISYKHQLKGSKVLN